VNKNPFAWIPAEESCPNGHEWAGVITNDPNHEYAHDTEFCPICGFLSRGCIEDGNELVVLSPDRLASHRTQFTERDGYWVSNHWDACERNN